MPTGQRDEKLLTTFVDKMIAEKHPEIKGERRIWLRNALVTELNTELDRAILMALEPEQLGQINTLLDSDADDAEIEAVLKTVDQEVIALKTLETFRNTYLERTDEEELISQGQAEMSQAMEEKAPGQGAMDGTPEVLVSDSELAEMGLLEKAHAVRDQKAKLITKNGEVA